MNAKRVWSLLALMVLTLSFSIASANEGRIGKNYVLGSFGLLWFDDKELDDFYGSMPIISVEGNFNIHENVDLSASVSRMKASGSVEGFSLDTTVNALSFGVSVFQQVDDIKLFGGASLSMYRGEYEEAYLGETYTETDSGSSHSFFAGLEVSLTQSIFAEVSLGRHFGDDSDSSTAVMAGLGAWVNERAFTGIMGTYDTGDIGMYSIEVGLGYTF